MAHEYLEPPIKKGDRTDRATGLLRKSGLGPRRAAVLVFGYSLVRGFGWRRAWHAGRLASTLARRPTVTERMSEGTHQHE